MVGIDMSKLQQAAAKMEERSNRGGKRTSVRFWKPKHGDNTIRILPPWTAEGEFAGVVWREVGQHWGVSDNSKGPLLCPRETPDINMPCPICEFVDELRGMRGDPEALQLAKDIRAKSAWFFNLVDLGDPVYTQNDVAEFTAARPDVEDLPFQAGDLKIQVYAAGMTVFRGIVSTITENNLDITHPIEGRDIKIKKSGAGINTKYDVIPLFKATKLEGFSDSTNIPALDQVGYRQDYAALQQALAEGKGGTFNPSMALGSGAGDTNPLPEAYGGVADDSADLANQLAAAIGS